MKHTVIVTLCAVFLGGCLKRELAVPTARHAQETADVAERCERGGYYEMPCDPELLRDLKITAEQAALIHAIITATGEESPK